MSSSTLPIRTSVVPSGEQVIIYIDENAGSDEKGTTGTVESPFSTLFAAYIRFPPESSSPPPIFKTRIAGNETGPPEWRDAAKTAMKKVIGRHNEYLKKLHKAEEEEEARQISLAEARKVVIKQDERLPVAIKMKISDNQPRGVILGNDSIAGTRVRVVGRIDVDRVRSTKTQTFVYLSDTRGILSCMFSGHLHDTARKLLQRQATLEVYGKMKEAPPDKKAPGDRELHVDFYSIIGEAPGGPESFSAIIPDDAKQSALSDLRHLVLRRPEESTVMKTRSSTLDTFRQYYKIHGMRESTAPSFVQTQVEGGGSLFGLDYYGQRVCLTQTSQLYLETQLPILGDCYTIQSSFRAENSQTRRHLAEYTHIEGELDFIVFEDLLQHIEDIICGVIDMLLADPESAAYIQTLNPGFKSPARPFKRMRYSEAIAWLNEHDVMAEEEQPHTFGVDIAEAAERAMTDQIGEPIMLTHFPVELKAFYMKKDASDPRVTESVDVLVPGVGEVVGGGMRIEDYEELISVMKENKWDLESYAFYADQRK